MFFRLFLIFTIIPVIELYLLIKIGSVIGALPTVSVILFTGALGAYMAKREGLQVIYELQATVNQGRIPGSQILHGILILVGAIALVTPGFLTDIIGFTLIFPTTRRFYLQFLLKFIAYKVSQGQLKFYSNIQNDSNYNQNHDSEWKQ